MIEHKLYSDFFGLTERPFTLTPDPAFLYWSQQHRRAFSVMEYGVMARAPITLITGEVGSGKTTLLRELLTKFDEDSTVGLVSNAQGGRGELVQWILNALSVPFENDASYVQNFQMLQDFLITEYSEGRRVILIFDEAQNLSKEGLEELRMLTNINADKDELIQLVLVGQPELRDMVLSPGMHQLAQRVTASFHLREMEPKTVREYIAHRLEAAGGSGEEFTPEACAVIALHSRGVPRLVNKLSEFAMLYAWSMDQRLITAETVNSVIKDGVFFAPAAPERETAD